ncbi:MAG: response regulator [Myxococcota bacterium]
MNLEKSTEKPVILAVDNDTGSLNLLQEKLKNKFTNKYTYETAQNAAEALKKIEQKNNGQIVLIISDQNIPDMKGDKLLEKIHQHHPKPIKILITDDASLQSVVNAINNADLYRYLPKPWETEDLLLTVQKAIEQYELREKTEQHLNSFRRFVPLQLANYLGKDDILQVKLGDYIHQEMHILLCDIHAFTSLSEKMTPQENFRFINNYLRYVEPAIREQDGFVENYIGDAVSALFHKPMQAVKASIGIQQAIAQFNAEQQLHISSGIALHAGNVMLGIVGGKKRMQGMVLSKAVLSTFMLQQLTSLGNCPVVASENILSTISPSNIDRRLLGYMRSQETDQFLQIYEILHENLEGSSGKQTTKATFENGIKQFFASDFTAAVASFNEVTKQNPKDTAALLYSKTAKSFTGKQLPQQWHMLHLLP